MKNTANFEITIDVTGSVTQGILLTCEQQMSKETFIEKMKEGKIFTSIGHGNNDGKIYWIDLPTFSEIGKVVYQVSNDDTELTIADYEFSDEESFSE